MVQMAANSLSIQTFVGAVRDKSDTLDLVVYWRSIAKRKWAILGLGLIAAACAALYVNIVTPIYRSTATLLIEQTRAKVAPTEEVYSSVGETREYFQTQAEILKSRMLAVKVVDKLDLTEHPRFDPRLQKSALLARIAQQVGISREELQWTEAGLQQAVVGALMSRMIIEPVRLSQLIKVHFDSVDPVTAAEIANVIAQAYIESDIESRDSLGVRASDWLGGRLEELKKNVEDSEQALQQYRERARLIEMRGLAQSGATRQIEDQTARMIAARQRRFAAEHAYDQVNSATGDLDVLPVVVGNAGVQRLKEAERDAERRVADAAQRYGPEHRVMIQAQTELRETRANTRREVETVVASLKNEYELARAAEQAFEQDVTEAKGNVQSINRKEFELASLESALANNRQIYDLFLNRFRETRASRDSAAGAIARVSDAARVAQEPFKPKPEQAISVAFVLGILLGALIALLLERLDNTLKSADDVEKKLGQPMLTVLPLLSGVAANSVGRHYLENPQSVFSEAIRTARTGVLLSAGNIANLTVLVTSSVPDEGKTAVAVNLALAQAQTKRVLLVDADLRRPLIGEGLGLDSSKPGLTDLLSGSATLAQCLQRVAGTSLYVIMAGTPPLNPLELILSKRFEALIRALGGACDFLVIDSPPLHLVSDSLVLSKMATGVLYVVKADSTPYPLVRRCLSSLQEMDARLFGITLNQLDFKKAERYYGGYSGTYPTYGSNQTRGIRSAAPALRT